jgi:hypothetical protein
MIKIIFLSLFNFNKLIRAEYLTYNLNYLFSVSSKQLAGTFIFYLCSFWVS